MKIEPTEIRTSALLDELRWFVANRWVAGALVMLGGIGIGIGVGWTDIGWIVAIGVGVLIYNAVICQFLRGEQQTQRLIVVAWAQLLLDFAALTLLTILNEGIFSPVLGLFILHMVFASILLPRRSSYLAAAVAIFMVFAGLYFSGEWDDSIQALQIFFGWMAMLIITIYLTSHITSTLRNRDSLLREYHRRTYAIVETAADGIISFDQEGVIESVNTRAQQMFGYEQGDLQGIQVTTLMPLPFAELLQDPDALQNLHSRKFGGRRLVSEMDCQRANGSSFPGEAAVTVIRVGNKLLFTTIVRDITDHKTAESELLTLNRQLQTQQESMIQHEKMVAVGRMAAGVAHEIANPLSNIDSIVQLAVRREKSLTPGQLDLVSEQVKRISNIINQLKGFAHPDETDWQIVPVNDLINKALAVLQFDRRHRFIEVANNLLEPCCQVRVQPQSIQQVFVNILVNALDATEESNAPRVVISSACGAEGCCRITFTDNGSGINESNLKEIFDPFFTTKPVGKGTGLGLSICQKLVERHQGFLEVTSSKGVGTAVTVIIPVVPQTAPQNLSIPTGSVDTSVPTDSISDIA